ncbi:HNH/ENDO VII family nuclease [Priestia megaterium]|uniref:HNH/ENDO VII family nuclease n=1 Tax=Priestia megaterium TaxID=1404 RepID=UPI000AE2C506
MFTCNEAADHFLDAYKSAKSFKVLEQTEKGLYGLVAANGLGEYMTGRDMFGNKISEEQRKASLLQALGIAGAGALSTKVAGKMGRSLATKGTEKLNNMRNALRTSAVANVTKQAYQSVKNAPASWTQSLHKTYNNILDSSMPRLMPDLVPAGPAFAQQTVRETLQNVKQQTMQMTQALYNPTAKRYQDPQTGRFVANPNVERVEKPVVKEVEKVQEVTNGTVKNDKTYSRPSGYRKGVRDEAWEKAKGADGKVRDPENGNVMNKEEPWDMGHKPGYEFRKHQKSAQERGISRKQFLDEHNNPDHYRPELPSTNRSHKGEDLTDNYFGD